MLEECKDNGDQAVWCQIGELKYGNQSKITTFSLIIKLFDALEDDILIQTIVCDVENKIQDINKFTNLLDGSCNDSILEALDQTMEENKEDILSKLEAED